MKITFVCTGNTCRSPMAEVIFNKLSRESSNTHIAVSRGTAVFFPQPMNAKSAEALLKNNFEPGQHRSMQLTEEDVKNSDLILTMTSAQKHELKNTFPHYKSGIFTVNEKAYGKESDIEDPFGKEQVAYDRCFAEILEAVSKILCVL